MSTYPEFPDDATQHIGFTASPIHAGREALDDNLEKIGTVTDVLYDQEGEARWAVVNPGLLHRERYVPVEGSFTTDDGQVVVPYSKDTVKSARAAGRDHVLDPVVERALEEHYAISHR